MEHHAGRNRGTAESIISIHDHFARSRHSAVLRDAKRKTILAIEPCILRREDLRVDT